MPKRIYFTQTLESYLDVDDAAIADFDLGSDNGYHEMDEWLLMDAELGDAVVLGVMAVEVTEVRDTPDGRHD